MGPGGLPGLQNRSPPAKAGGLGSTPRRFRHYSSRSSVSSKELHPLYLLRTRSRSLTGLSSILSFLQRLEVQSNDYQTHAKSKA